MTINIFVLKGDLNGKIIVVCFFFCRVYLVKYMYHIFTELPISMGYSQVKSLKLWCQLKYEKNNLSLVKHPK